MTRSPQPAWLNSLLRRKQRPLSTRQIRSALRRAKNAIEAEDKATPYGQGPMTITKGRRVRQPIESDSIKTNRKLVDIFPLEVDWEILAKETVDEPKLATATTTSPEGGIVTSLAKELICSACLLELLEESDPSVAILSSCLHLYHQNCIERWANTENTCCQCKQRFLCYGVYDSKGHRSFWQTVQMTDQAYDPDAMLEEVLPCRHCGQIGDRESLIACEHCNYHVHFYCLGLEVRPTTFVCPGCRRRANGRDPLTVNSGAATIVRAAAVTAVTTPGGLWLHRPTTRSSELDQYLMDEVLPTLPARVRSPLLPPTRAAAQIARAAASMIPANAVNIHMACYGENDDEDFVSESEDEDVENEEVDDRVRVWYIDDEDSLDLVDDDFLPSRGQRTRSGRASGSRQLRRRQRATTPATAAVRSTAATMSSNSRCPISIPINDSLDASSSRTAADMHHNSGNQDGSRATEENAVSIDDIDDDAPILEPSTGGLACAPDERGSDTGGAQPRRRRLRTGTTGRIRSPSTSSMQQPATGVVVAAAALPCVQSSLTDSNVRSAQTSAVSGSTAANAGAPVSFRHSPRKRPAPDENNDDAGSEPSVIPAGPTLLLRPVPGSSSGADIETATTVCNISTQARPPSSSRWTSSAGASVQPSISTTPAPVIQAPAFSRARRNVSFPAHISGPWRRRRATVSGGDVFVPSRPATIPRDPRVDLQEGLEVYGREGEPNPGSLEDLDYVLSTPGGRELDVELQQISRDQHHARLLPSEVGETETPDISDLILGVRTTGLGQQQCATTGSSTNFGSRQALGPPRRSGPQLNPTSVTGMSNHPMRQRCANARVATASPSQIRRSGLPGDLNQQQQHQQPSRCKVVVPGVPSSQSGDSASAAIQSRIPATQRTSQSSRGAPWTASFSAYSGWRGDPSAWMGNSRSRRLSAPVSFDAALESLKRLADASDSVLGDGEQSWDLEAEAGSVD